MPTIDIFRDELIPLSKSHSLPGRPHKSTVYRWATIGRMSVDGQMVFLETVKIGLQRYTTATAYRQFCTELTEGDSGGKK